MKKGLLAAVVWLAAAFWTLWPLPVYSHNPVTTTVLFNREVVKIFQAKCLQCHNEGAMAMSLRTYEEARPWAVAIKEEVLARRMPPWPAQRGYGDFANDVGLTNRELDFLISWVEGGVPSGTDAPPDYVDHSAHWMLGEPDSLSTSKAGVLVPPDGGPTWKRLVMDPKNTTDQWVHAIDYKVGDKRVTRAAFFSVLETGEYLGAWTAWHSSTELPEGVAYRLPARSHIAVDILYKPIDTPVTDRPSLGLYFAKTPPRSPMTTMMISSSQGVSGGSAAAGHRIAAKLELPKPTRLFEIRPELAPTGRSIEIRAKRPDGSSQILLWIQNFRPEWPTPYVLRQPVVLPAGSSILATAYFDSKPAEASIPSFLKVSLNVYEVATTR